MIIIVLSAALALTKLSSSFFGLPICNELLGNLGISHPRLHKSLSNNYFIQKSASYSLLYGSHYLCVLGYLVG